MPSTGQGNLTVLIVIIGIALVFDFINGFHDSANSIVTLVSTRVLTPKYAVIWAALFNFVAVGLLGFKVAKTMATEIVEPGIAGNEVVFSALMGAITWNLITWYYGIPSSSSHALIGGILGAAVAEAGTAAPKWDAVVRNVVVPLFASPVIGFLLAAALMLLLMRGFFHSPPSTVSAVFGRLQVVSSAFMAFSHGGNDAQKTMG